MANFCRAERKYSRNTVFTPVASAWWWPRFEQIALWMIGREKGTSPADGACMPEVKGSFELQGITFTGRADRIRTG